MFFIVCEIKFYKRNDAKICLPQRGRGTALGAVDEESKVCIA